ncbi:MAG TPA: winged helix-turn-helix domain-containing protein [Solirubrobacterales bacterium]|jgi:predicted ArsR family transcriptional regulator
MSSKGTRPPKLVDDRLTVALSHDTRQFALSVCSIRPTSTKEIADALEISVSAAWHHVDKLVKLGCLKEVRSQQRRGARERFYEATCDYYFDSDAWEKVPVDQRSSITMRILRLIAHDVDLAVKAKTIEAADSHLSRITINLDPKGRKEAYAVLGKALDGLVKVRKRCVARADKGEVDTTPASLVLMQLEFEPRRIP